ncbi:superoxide dismutase [Methylomicrobium lacus]|uniref:superoxide dismutase n=1 Tax=Methylomicrobium lacus TaxID=136992 RepID=UPI00045EAE02|nr:Fe-Mn family superoxide dismutase [Methylomicrobium lacus]
MSTNNSRRDFLSIATAGAALALLEPEQALAASETKSALVTTLPDAFSTEHAAKPLSFDPAKLDGLSEKLIRSHWENNYGGSVKALNAVKKKLASFREDADLPAFVYNDLKREHLLRTGSVVLHELYFSNLGSTAKPEAALRNLIGSAFGSFETWEKEFRRIGAGLSGGSGWVTLGLNLHTGLLENYWQWDHLHAPAATMPILVLDMYEHSYQMDYGAAAPAYLDAFFRNIHWESVASRLNTALKLLALARQST